MSWWSTKIRQALRHATGRVSEAEREGLSGVYTHAITRPTVTESEAVARAINLADAAGGRLYIVHMSTGQSLDHVEEGIVRGVDVHAETGPHYLLLDDELYEFVRPGGSG